MQSGDLAIIVGWPSNNDRTYCRVGHPEGDQRYVTLLQDVTLGGFNGYVDYRRGEVHRFPENMLRKDPELRQLRIV